jgi:hypothetical protein
MNISSVKYFHSQLLESAIKSFVKNCSNGHGCFPRFLTIDFPAAVALGRHHAIPSRLLDWSRDPLVAAFFSASSCNIDKSGKICTWALKKNVLNENNGHGQLLFYEGLSRYGLEFLHIQKGLFTDMMGIEYYYFKHGKWPALNEYLAQSYTSPHDSKSVPQSSYLKKIEVDASQVPELLKRLDRMGINQHSLMPTYDNVGKYVLSLMGG